MTCKHAWGDLFREIKLGWALRDGLMFSFAWPGRVNQEIWFAVTVERGGHSRSSLKSTIFTNEQEDTQEQKARQQKSNTAVFSLIATTAPSKWKQLHSSQLHQPNHHRAKWAVFISLLQFDILGNSRGCYFDMQHPPNRCCKPSTHPKVNDTH